MRTQRVVLALAVLLVLAGCPDVKPPKDPPRVPHPKAEANASPVEPAPTVLLPTPESGQRSEPGYEAGASR